MNILIVSYLDYVTNQIEIVIKQACKDVNINITKSTSKANFFIMQKECDLVIIDMMVQEYSDKITKPILESSITFLKSLKSEYPAIKAFALFDEDETGKKGQDEISDLGYELAAYNPFSKEWEEKLKNYI